MDALEKRNKNCPKTKTRKEKSGSEASHEAPHHAAGSRTQQLIAECSSRLDFNQGSSCGLASGSVDFDDFFKISNKLLFIIKLISAV
jgi:hypothetical protein